MQLLERLRTRGLPAVITALGIVLLTAGLLSYADPTTAGTFGDDTPVIETLDPSGLPSPIVTPEPSTSLDPSASPTSPIASLDPTPTPADRAVATRVVVPALNIDMPVIRGPAGYPPCNVAMYMAILSQPGEGHATYLYGHARRGMFLPLLEQSKVNNGRAMLGMVVEVYTSHDLLYLYEIVEVRRHQRTLDRALAAPGEELWLQTSEGPNSTYPKLQIVARPVAPPTMADPAEAEPKPRPVAC